MKKHSRTLIGTIVIILMLQAGCVPTGPASTPTSLPAETSSTPTTQPLPSLLVPQTTALVFTDMSVRVESSLPAKAIVTVKGNQPESCTQLKTSYYTRGESGYEVAVLGERPQDVMCAQVITPFSVDITIDLSGKPAGEYTVTLSEFTRSFTLRDQINTPVAERQCPPRLPGTYLYESKAKEEVPAYCFLYLYGYKEQEVDGGRQVTLNGPSYSYSTGVVSVKTEIVVTQPKSSKPLIELVRDDLNRQQAMNRSEGEAANFAGQAEALSVTYLIKDVQYKSIYFVNEGWLYRITLSPDNINSNQIKNDIKAVLELLAKSFTILN